MEVIEQEKTSILRVFVDGNKYGDKFLLSLFCSYYGKYNETVILEGLDDKMTIRIKSAISEYFRKKGTKFIKWDHTNNRGQERHVCFETETGKMRFE